MALHALGPVAVWVMLMCKGTGLSLPGWTRGHHSLTVVRTELGAGMGTEQGHKGVLDRDSHKPGPWAGAAALSDTGGDQLE